MVIPGSNDDIHKANAALYQSAGKQAIRGEGLEVFAGAHTT